MAPVCASSVCRRNSCNNCSTCSQISRNKWGQFPSSSICASEDFLPASAVDTQPLRTPMVGSVSEKQIQRTDTFQKKILGRRFFIDGILFCMFPICMAIRALMHVWRQAFRQQQGTVHLGIIWIMQKVCYPFMAFRAGQFPCFKKAIKLSQDCDKHDYTYNRP